MTYVAGLPAIRHHQWGSYFFLPKRPGIPVLLRMAAPLLPRAVALPLASPLMSAVMTGFSAVPVMLMGIPVAADGLPAAEVLFNFVRIFTPTLLRPLALVTLQIR